MQRALNKIDRLSTLGSTENSESNDIAFTLLLNPSGSSQPFFGHKKAGEKGRQRRTTEILEPRYLKSDRAA